MYDPAALHDAAETIRQDLITAAALELADYIRKTGFASQTQLLDIFDEWGFDPTEWILMSQEERIRIIQAKADAQRGATII